MLVLTACVSEPSGRHGDIDTEGIDVDIRLRRLDSIMYETPTDQLPEAMTQFRRRDSLMFELYVGRILGLPLQRWRQGVQRWASNASMNTLYEDVDSAYQDLSPLEQQLEAAFARHVYFFPDDTVPRFYSILTATYQVVTYPQTVGISLDMFLGKDYRFYPSMGYPDYKIIRFQRPYIMPNVMKAWFGQRFPEERYTDRKLLSQMIYQGKALAYAEAMLPDAADSLLLEYTGAQMEWCRLHEAQIWTHFIENDLLYVSTPQTIDKYMADGPFTVASGIPQKSAPRLGAYIGWRIIRSYLEQDPGRKLVDLLQNQDYRQILSQSRYKPSS